MKAEDIIRAIELGKSYLKVEAGLDDTMLNISALFIGEFLITASRREWPVLSKEMPEILRALALILEDIQKNNKIET